MDDIGTTTHGTLGNTDSKLGSGSTGDKHLPTLFKGDLKYDDKLLDYGFENIKKRYMCRMEQAENMSQSRFNLTRRVKKGTVYERTINSSPINHIRIRFFELKTR
jgi:hypothetical protein